MAKGTVTKVNNKKTASVVAAKSHRASRATALPAAREAVAKRAFEIYLDEGRPEGRQEEHWRLAELELKTS